MFYPQIIACVFCIYSMIHSNHRFKKNIRKTNNNILSWMTQRFFTAKLFLLPVSSPAPPVHPPTSSGFLLTPQEQSRTVNDLNLKHFHYLMMFYSHIITKVLLRVMLCVCCVEVSIDVITPCRYNTTIFSCWAKNLLKFLRVFYK